MYEEKEKKKIEKKGIYSSINSVCERIGLAGGGPHTLKEKLHGLYILSGASSWVS